MRSPASAKAPTHQQRLLILLLLPLAACALLALLYFGKPLLLPFALALGLQVLLSPLVKLAQRRLRLPRFLAGSLAFCLAAGLLAGLLIGATARLSELLKDLPAMQAAYSERLEALRTWTSGQPLGTPLADLLQSVLPQVLQQTLSGAYQAVANSFQLAGTTLLMLFFLLIKPERAFSNAPGNAVRITESVQRYLLIKTLSSALTGAATYILLALLGVRWAGLLALAAFGLNYIPYLGAMVALLLPLPVVLASGGGVADLALVLGLTLTAQVAIGSLLEPRWMGQVLDMHPVLVLMALLAWGALWGVPGAVVALPATVVVRGWLRAQPGLWAHLRALFVG
jgi:AI-2 transport protein TqsA